MPSKFVNIKTKIDSQSHYETDEKFEDTKFKYGTPILVVILYYVRHEQRYQIII